MHIPYTLDQLYPQPPIRDDGLVDSAARNVQAAIHHVQRQVCPSQVACLMPFQLSLHVHSGTVSANGPKPYLQQAHKVAVRGRVHRHDDRQQGPAVERRRCPVLLVALPDHRRGAAKQMHSSFAVLRGCI